MFALEHPPTSADIGRRTQERYQRHMADYATDIAPETVVMFSTPWCGYCKRLKLLMSSDGIPFVEVDIEQDAAAEQFVLQANGDGTATVPTLRFPDGSSAVNPTIAQVRDRLAAIA